MNIATKWPQMIVTGTPVTLEQAKEIIRRTDSFFRHGGGGNNQEYEKAVCKLLGIKRLDDLWEIEDTQQRMKAFSKQEEHTESRLKKWQYIETEYVYNSWISSCFVGGPHGWCHPDGTIGYIDNIGKWPSAEDVINEWSLIAKEFPFLDLIVKLVEDEGDGVAAGYISVKDGYAIECEQHVADESFARFPEPCRTAGVTDKNANVIENWLSRSENAISEEWIREWARFK